MNTFKNQLTLVNNRQRWPSHKKLTSKQTIKFRGINNNPAQTVFRRFSYAVRNSIKFLYEYISIPLLENKT